MLSDTMKLEKLLEKLFDDDDESTSEDIIVLKGRTPPRPFNGACCTYNYAAYNG